MMDPNSHDTTEQLEERVALYALDLMAPEEAKALDERLRQGDPRLESALRLYREAAASLALSLPEEPPGSGLRSRVMDAIARESQQPAGEINMRFEVAIRAGEMDWQQTPVPGVKVKRLFLDRQAGLQTSLLRMEAGASFPAHRHAKAEQCLVLEGDVGWKDLIFTAGDFVCFPQGSAHPVIQTVKGNLLLIVGDPRVDFITA
jgi:quercetin dioxygenase-like cupin family protein